MQRRTFLLSALLAGAEPGPESLLVDGEPYYESRVREDDGDLILGDMAKIFRQYLGGLGREPQAGGYAFWWERIEDGRLTRQIGRAERRQAGHRLVQGGRARFTHVVDESDGGAEASVPGVDLRHDEAHFVGSEVLTVGCVEVAIARIHRRDFSILRIEGDGFKCADVSGEISNG